MRPAEETVVRQCAPTLAGIKTGSLFPCPYQSRQQLLADIRRMNRVLVPRGLCLLPMRMGQGRALLYLYRPQALCRDLGDDLACRLLRQAAVIVLLWEQLEALLGDTGAAESVRIDAVEQGSWLLVTLRAECLEEIGREVPLTKE